MNTTLIIVLIIAALIGVVLISKAREPKKPNYTDAFKTVTTLIGAF